MPIPGKPIRRPQSEHVGKAAPPATTAALRRMEATNRGSGARGLGWVGASECPTTLRGSEPLARAVDQSDGWASAEILPIHFGKKSHMGRRAQKAPKTAWRSFVRRANRELQREDILKLGYK